MPAPWPFPAPGLNDRPEAGDEPALNQIALFALDPAATATDQRELGKILLKNRKLLISPDSQLAAAGILPPLNRLTTASTDGAFGDLVDPKARAVERGLATGIRSYLEQPLVPMPQASILPPPENRSSTSTSFSPTTVLKPSMKWQPSSSRRCRSSRIAKAAFPDDYLKTLAANTLDYADSDTEANGRRQLSGLGRLSTGKRVPDALPV